MSRLKDFKAMVEVSGDFMRQDQKMAFALAHEALKDHLSDELRGPRGGRYEPVGEIRFYADPQPDLMRDMYFVGARRQARYIRPPKP